MSILDKKIGIIGGGQLGKMMALDAKRMGFFVATLDPSQDCPSHSVSDLHIAADFGNRDALAALAKEVDVVTYEFEHIGAEALLALERDGAIVYPTASSLITIQNKIAQKTALVKAGIPVPRFRAVGGLIDVVDSAGELGFPLLLKKSTGGYDGKGNAVISGFDGACAAFDALGGSGLFVEKFVDFQMEISVLACRSVRGEIAVYPVGQNIHLNNILDKTIVPADLPEEVLERAAALSRKVMKVFGGVGMFCVELFVLKDFSLMVNEVAPRPHNSGHYTIEGCMTSQFEQHIRAITGLPLGGVALRSPCVMRNILGSGPHSGRAAWSGEIGALAADGVKLHVYGKSVSNPGRKMGHLTAVADTAAEAEARVDAAFEKISVKGI